MTPVVLATVEYECPLWVISGHSEQVRAMSALPPKADMLSVGIDVC